MWAARADCDKIVVFLVARASNQEAGTFSCTRPFGAHSVDAKSGSRCTRTRADFSIPARAAAHASSRSRGIVACSVHTAMSLVRRSSRRGHNEALHPPATNDREQIASFENGRSAQPSSTIERAHAIFFMRLFATYLYLASEINVTR